MMWGTKNITYYGGQKWVDDVHCGVVCAGENLNTSFVNSTNGTKTYGRTSGQLCFGKTQFPEVLPGLSGFVTNLSNPALSVDAFSIVDHVLVPDDLEPGDYLLSWRWDCEQSPQIWQACADITVKAKPTDWWLPFLISVTVGGGCLLIVITLAIVFYTRWQRAMATQGDQIGRLLDEPF